MPQPFEQFTMDQLKSFTTEDFFKAQINQVMLPKEIADAQKIASLAHFLVQNFRDELSPEEHVIDTAIRIMKRI